MRPAHLPPPPQDNVPNGIKGTEGGIQRLTLCQWPLATNVTNEPLKCCRSEVSARTGSLLVVWTPPLV